LREITKLQFHKGVMMRQRFQPLALPAIVLGISLSGGCGGPANEENMADTKRAPIDPNVQSTFKDYGEKVRYDQEKAKKEAAAKTKGPAETKTAQ
jgi:hypothetical protein